jgi:Na+/proline symporter
MSDGFSIAAGSYSPGVFDCPKCKQTIDASSVTCRFCGAVVDRDIAEKSAVLLAKVNRAISEANYMRTVALSLPVFFLLRLLPFFSLMGELGFTVVSIAVPIWGVVWWFRYNALEYDDAEFKKSRRAVLIATIVVAAVCVLFLFVPFLIGFVMGATQIRPGPNV